MASSTPSSRPALQRTTGVLRIGFDSDGERTRLATLYQEGAARARLPRVGRGAPPEAVLINTAGGLTGGDRMCVEVRVDPGAAATLTTQASEKIYRASDGVTRVSNRIEVGAGGRLEWIPQETILFDQARLDRTLEVEASSTARVLLVEGVVFGRTAMGETVRHTLLRDRWRVRRGGTLVFADGMSLHGEVGRALTSHVGLEGGCATATLLLMAPDAEQRLESVREALGIELAAPEGGGRGPTAPAAPVSRVGASAWDGLLCIRIAAKEGAYLRAALELALGALRDGRPLPTVWHC